MIEQTLIQEIHTLPESLKHEVLHYVQFLKQKQNGNIKVEKPRKKRKAGSAKGEIFMAEDFDEPLEDFAEYM
jgi:translation initiation factor 2 beta subunit (eIF-2beta)/eIF-5